MSKLILILPLIFAPYQVFGTWVVCEPWLDKQAKLIESRSNDTTWLVMYQDKKTKSWYPKKVNPNSCLIKQTKKETKHD